MLKLIHFQLLLRFEEFQVLSSNNEDSVRNLISKIIENPFGKVCEIHYISFFFIFIFFFPILELLNYEADIMLTLFCF